MVLSNDEWKLELYRQFRRTIDEYVFPLILKNSEENDYVPIECNGKQVGFLIVCDEGYVDAIYVLPEYRRRGLARKAVLDYMDAGHEIDQMHIVQTNETALKFWNSIFELDGGDSSYIDRMYYVVSRRDKRCLSVSEIEDRMEED